MKRLTTGGVLFLMILVVFSSPAPAQKKHILSISSGGVGGVSYAIAGGLANIINKHVPQANAMVEVTAGGVSNCQLVGMGKSDLGMGNLDTVLRAYQGKDMFKEKLPLRTLAALYPQAMHIVALDGKGIKTVADLKGKRVSTGSPGSGTEVKALKILEAAGLTPDKDLKRDKLGASESTGALKDRKIDAFFFDAGLPVSTIMDLGFTPGIKIKLIPHADVIPKITEKYGPIYVGGVIPAKTYPGQEADVPVAVVWQGLFCHANMDEALVYAIMKAVFEHKAELVATHAEGKHVALENQKGNSAVPFHPGVVRYFKEKGVKVE